MKTTRTITCLLVPIFLGLTIGGAIANNTAAWICGLILLILDIIVGISIQYLIERNSHDITKNYFETENDETHFELENFEDESDISYNNDINELFKYMKKIENIMNSSNAMEYFTPKEIVYGNVNLADAQSALTPKEYYFVSRVFEKYSMMNKKLLFSHDDFVIFLNKMIAEFDLVAPYYKYSGNTDSILDRQFDFIKSDFRKKARVLLEQNKIFSLDWQKLHNDFYVSFYATRQ